MLGGVLAAESFTLSQCFYFGRVNGAPYECAQDEGRCIDELDELDDIAVHNKAKPADENDDPPAGGDERPSARRDADHTDH